MNNLPLTQLSNYSCWLPWVIPFYEGGFGVAFDL